MLQHKNIFKNILDDNKITRSLILPNAKKKGKIKGDFIQLFFIILISSFFKFKHIVQTSFYLHTHIQKHGPTQTSVKLLKESWVFS